MKNLANIITLTRIFFVFIVAALLFCTDCSYSYITALILTAVLMWFDGLDGFVARKLTFHQNLAPCLILWEIELLKTYFG